MLFFSFLPAASACSLEVLKRAVCLDDGEWSESRQYTINKGRQLLVNVAQRMQLPPHFVDAAHRFFKLAMQRRFLQGRRSEHVAAACLYAVCRQEKGNRGSCLPLCLCSWSRAAQKNAHTHVPCLCMCVCARVCLFLACM